MGGALKRKQGVTAKQILEKAQELSHLLKGELISTQIVSVDSEELMSRYVSRLNLSNKEVVAPAIHITKTAFRIGLVPNSPQLAVISSSIYIVAWLLNAERKPTFTEIANVTRSGEAEVKEAYAAMRGNLRTLLSECKGFVSRLPGGVEGLPAAKRSRKR